MIEFITDKEDAKNIHPMDEVFSTPGLNVENSQLDTELDTVADFLGKDKDPDPKDDTVKDRDLVDLGEESPINSEKEKEHPKENSPSLLQALKMIKSGRKRKMKGCVHFYK